MMLYEHDFRWTWHYRNMISYENDIIWTWFYMNMILWTWYYMHTILYEYYIVWTWYYINSSNIWYIMQPLSHWIETTSQRTEEGQSLETSIYGVYQKSFVFHQKTFSINSVVFHQKFLTSKVVFPCTSSSIEGCLLLTFVLHLELSCIIGHLPYPPVS